MHMRLQKSARLEDGIALTSASVGKSAQSLIVLQLQGSHVRVAKLVYLVREIPDKRGQVEFSSLLLLC